MEQSINSEIVLTNNGTYAYLNNWSEPTLIDTREVGKTIELIYKQYSLITYTVWPSVTSERVFKIIYSCKKGKWNKSEPIYGTIIPATQETYEFEE